MTIESSQYAETRAQLRRDPIIQQMAEELIEGIQSGSVSLGDFTDGREPKWGFMQRILEYYQKKGGKIPTHIGGPAEAILELVREEENE